MSLRKTSFVEGEVYHIYNRGNNKQEIFHDKEDYFRFMSLMFACNSLNNFKSDSLNKNQTPYSFERGNTIVSIGAYCLMFNHFHILIKQKTENGISKFMQKLCTSYSMYYNKKYQRTGSLFEGKFKSKISDSDRYLKYLFSYIYLNPIKNIDSNWKEKNIIYKKDIKFFLKNYEYSSFMDFFNKRIHFMILEQKAFPEYFANTKVLEDEVFSWFNSPLGKA
jgi:REP element-mobilizing transposase RayT